MPIYLGLDWSEQKHDVVFLNAAGAALAHLILPHTRDGLLQLETARTDLGLLPRDCLVGLETAHNLVIDFLWAHEYTQVYVIPPSLVKASRGRFGQSGARSDLSDARLLADLVRTDRVRLQPWHPDSLLTRQLRAKVSLLNYLTHLIVRHTNRMRSVLLRYYPAALQVFGDLTTKNALEFIRTYPTPQAAAAVTWAEFQAFAHAHRYPKPALLPKRYAHLQEPQPQATADTVAVYQGEAVLLATLLLSLIQAKQTALHETQPLFQQHPDHAIFDSLPGAGDLLAPALLVLFGDDRHRFPTPASVQALAGTCPLTEASGKRHLVKFRRGCNREFRHIAQQYALNSIRESPWARAYYEQVRPHCASENHAYRCLANRWLGIIWKLWQTRQPYDEAQHLAQRAARSKPRT
jgi:transposase